LRQGKEPDALQALRKGLQIGKEKGFVNLFMCQKDVMEVILSKALDAGIEVSYARDLIQRNAVMPDASCVENENWPWPIKIYTLGRFGLIKDGKPLIFSRKVQQKPLLMLKALIASGGREVTEERLADILWPEAEGDAAHSSFATTLSRLRHLLGIEQAIRFQEGKAFLDPRYCWVDVWSFERILGKAENAWNEGLTERDRDQTVYLTEKAVRMYSGPFLAGDHEPWMMSIRERLRNKFLRNVRRLGDYWEQAGKLDKAVECYQKGLEVDDLAEEFYQRLMKCYKRMDRRAEALVTYKRCYQILSAVLGIEPSPETEALVKELKAGG
jgi:DNA-binding SARP family transcriptional activator